MSDAVIAEKYPDHPAGAWLRRQRLPTRHPSQRHANLRCRANRLL